MEGPFRQQRTDVGSGCMCIAESDLSLLLWMGSDSNFILPVSICTTILQWYLNKQVNWLGALLIHQKHFFSTVMFLWGFVFGSSAIHVGLYWFMSVVSVWTSKAYEIWGWKKVRKHLKKKLGKVNETHTSKAEGKALAFAEQNLSCAVLSFHFYFFWLLAWKEWPLFEHGAYFCLL